MSKENESKVTMSSGNIGFGGLLGIVLIVLKLIGVINWAWWIVLSPLWAPIALLVVIFVVMLIVVAIATALGS